MMDINIDNSFHKITVNIRQTSKTTPKTPRNLKPFEVISCPNKHQLVDLLIINYYTVIVDIEIVFTDCSSNRSRLLFKH